MEATHTPVMAAIKGSRKYPIDTAYFRDIVTPPQAYWLGFLAADLTLRPNNWTADLRLAARDRDHLMRFRSALRSEIPVRDYSVRLSQTGRSYPAASFAFTSKEMMADLRRHGLNPSTKSRTLRPWAGPPDLLPYWWLGLWDGDGSLPYCNRQKSHRVATLVGTREVVDGFVEFAESRCGPLAHHFHFHTNIWHVFFRRAPSVSVATLLYGQPHAAALALPRKLASAVELMHDPPRVSPMTGTTADGLAAMKVRFGTWRAVADHLQCSHEMLLRRVRTLGLARPRPYAGRTLDEFERLKSQHGTWASVARSLGGSEAGLQRARRQLAA